MAKTIQDWVIEECEKAEDEIPFDQLPKNRYSGMGYESVRAMARKMTDGTFQEVVGSVLVADHGSTEDLAPYSGADTGWRPSPLLMPTK